MALRKNKIAKISILILMLLSLFLGFKFYKVSDDFDKYVEISDLENKVLESQLTEILHKYDSVSLKNKMDSLHFDEQIKIVESGNVTDNANKVKELEDSKVLNSKQQQKSNITVSKSSATLLKSSPKNAQLTALNVNAKGVKIYSETYKMSESKIQQLRVCFTLEENQLVTSGNKTIYVQIVNPKNQIISFGDMSVESETHVKLQYSASVNANYLKKDTDVCTYVDLEKNKTIKGQYKINIYNDFVKIGTTIFEYQ